ncbi:MAG TPA: hypothetical protein VFU22_09585 [Roseiflexaceae bacterium]|nr:hypothetical protein [Roseiflexaceae bacterium]
MAERLFHLSDDPGITRFEPRLPPSTSSSGIADPVVWAVGERLRHNYLLPRDCPRVTFYPSRDSDPADRARLMAGSNAGHVVAIETGWMPALRQGRLYQYELPPDSFLPVDVGAGYYVSREPVVPLGMVTIDDLLGELLACDVELRVMPSLWKLCDAVVASSLQFSCIRMRNARPREDGRKV